MITMFHTVLAVRTVLVLAAGGPRGGRLRLGRRLGDADVPRVVVTTNILGDVVENLVGDDADVEVVMPPNADPHDFAASAQQAASMREADALVVNGLGFEEGLVDTIDAAADDGVPVITATDAIEPHPLGRTATIRTSSPTRCACAAAAALIADQLGGGDPSRSTRPRRRRG